MIRIESRLYSIWISVNRAIVCTVSGIVQTMIQLLHVRIRAVGSKFVLVRRPVAQSIAHARSVHSARSAPPKENFGF